MKDLKLFAEEDCWKFKENFPVEWESFGCGPGTIGDWLVPDTVWGLSIKAACQIHDWDTRFAPEASEEHRLKIARIFKWNCIRIVVSKTKNTFLLKLRLARVETYYGMVVKFGGPAYWEERNPDSKYKFITQEA